MVYTLQSRMQYTAMPVNPIRKTFICSMLPITNDIQVLFNKKDGSELGK
jgi:hypothetical protein